MDKEGRLTNVDKVRGRNKSIQTIVNETVKTIVAPLDQIVYVAYAGDLESAEKAKRLLEEQKKEVEADLEKAIQKARRCGISDEDLKDIFELLLEG